jgi:hypothetical protein
MNNPVPLRRIEARETDMQEAVYGQAHWLLLVNNDVTLAEVLRPAFWVQVLGRLRAPAEKSVGTVVTVISRDGNFECDVRVEKIEASLAFVRLRTPASLYEHPDRIRAAKALATAIEGDLPDTPEGYKIGFTPKANNAAGGYYVLLEATGARLYTAQTKRGAIEYAIEHAKKAGTYVEAAKPEEPAAEAAA